MEQQGRDPILTMRQSLHELAQPLAALAGLVDLLLLEVDEADPRHREIQLISQQVERVLAIIGEIRRIFRDAAASGDI